MEIRAHMVPSCECGWSFASYDLDFGEINRNPQVWLIPWVSSLAFGNDCSQSLL